MRCRRGSGRRGSPPTPTSWRRRSRSSPPRGSGGVRTYTWQVHYRCFCPEDGPLTIAVEDGTVASVTDAAGTAVTGRLPAFALTIDSLYAQLADSVSRGGTVTGTFREGGVPKQISVDPIRNAVDDEYGIEVLSFSPAG